LPAPSESGAIDRVPALAALARLTRRRRAKALALLEGALDAVRKGAQ